MVRANALICLIHQANYLLDQQIAATERQFVEEGGYSEQLAAARLEERERKRNNRADQADRPGRADRIPACPKCGKTMVLRTVKRGPIPATGFGVVRLILSAKVRRRGDGLAFSSLHPPGLLYSIPLVGCNSSL